MLITKDIINIINEIIEIKKINGEPNYLIVKPDTYAYNFIINVSVDKRS